jgi:hypothetical protein
MVFDALFLWLFVAPIFTITAIARMSKRRFRKATSARWKVGVWLAVLLVLCLNLFLVAGFVAAAYY